MQNKFPILKSLSLGLLGLLAAGLTGCCDDSFTTDSKPSTGGSSTVSDNTISFVDPGMHDVAVGEEAMTLPLQVQLAKPASEDVTFTIYADAEMCDWYNANNGTDYVMLPSMYYDVVEKLTIPKGESGAVLDVNLQPLPSSMVRYALSLRIADVAGPAALNANGAGSTLGSHQMLYAFYRGNFVSIAQAFDSSSARMTVDGPTELPLDVRVTDPLMTDLTVTMQLDQSVLDAFNAENASSYVMLPASNYSWNKTATIEAGYTSASMPVTVSSLPDDDKNYAIAVSVASISDESVLKDEDRGSFVYLLGKGLAPAIHKTAIFSGFTGITAISVSVGQTLQQWTFEYWVKHDDNSGLSTSSYDWLDASNESAEWRKRVYPPQSAPAKLPSPIDFKFWPQGNQPLSPMMQFTQNSVLSASIKNNGFAFMPDEWTHVAFTYDATDGTLKYYINGVQYGFGGDCNANDGGAQTFSGMTATYANATSWSTLTLVTPGASGQTYYQYYKVEMAQMRLWGKVLSEAEINEVKGCEILPEDGVYPSELKAYWPMDEGTGTVLKDVVGGKNISNSSYIKWSTEECDFSNPNK